MSADAPRYHYVPLPVDLAIKLRAMADTARAVNGATPDDDPARTVSVEFSALLAKLHSEGVTYRALAEAAGVSKAAIRLRLARHGHKPALPSVALYKGQRVGRASGGICIHGHDTNVVGRYPGGDCKKCASERSAQSYRRKKEAKAHSAVAEALLGRMPAREDLR